MAALRQRLGALHGATFSGLWVASADDFAYLDPVDGSTSSRQGVRILFDGGSRVVFRLSGTGTEGATLRVYLERFEPGDGAIGEETPVMLAPLIAAAEAVAGIAAHTGRTAPDVVT
jgi:phosphoglucomutase